MAAMRTTPPIPRALLWAVICGGLIAGMSIGIRHVHGLFMLPMTFDRGWSRETFSFALALQNLSWGLAQPLAGWFADRFGGARVLAFGVLLYGASLALMSQVHSHAALYAVAGVGIGVAQACTAFAAVYGVLNRLAPDALRGWALSVAGAIGALVQFVAVPAAQALIGHVGWGAALMALGLFAACLLPATLSLREPTSRGLAHAKPGGPGAAEAVRLALGSPGFRWLLLGFAVCGFQLAFIANHMPAYLLAEGAAPGVAVAGLGLIALANIPGTYVCGRLGGPYRPQRVLALLYLLRAMAMTAFVIAPKSAPVVLAFCAVMGFLWLGTLPLTNTLVTQMFGVSQGGTLFGLVFMGHQLGAFAGVWLGGWVFDRFHGYTPMWGVAIGVGLLAALLHLPIAGLRHPRFAAA